MGSGQLNELFPVGYCDVGGQEESTSLLKSLWQSIHSPGSHCDGVSPAQACRLKIDLFF